MISRAEKRRNTLTGLEFLYDGRIAAEQTMTDFDIQQSLKGTVYQRNRDPSAKIFPEQHRATLHLLVWYPIRLAIDSKPPNEHPQEKASSKDVPAQRHDSNHCRKKRTLYIRSVPDQTDGYSTR